MIIKYKNYIGELIHYEKLDNEKIGVILLDIDGRVELRFTCLESEITIPNVMGNSRILYDIEKQKEEGGEEDD